MRTTAWPFTLALLAGTMPVQPSTWPEARTVRHRLADDDSGGVTPGAISALLVRDRLRSAAALREALDR